MALFGKVGKASVHKIDHTESKQQQQQQNSHKSTNYDTILFIIKVKRYICNFP